MINGSESPSGACLLDRRAQYTDRAISDWQFRQVVEIRQDVFIGLSRGAPSYGYDPVPDTMSLVYKTTADQSGAPGDQ